MPTRMAKMMKQKILCFREYVRQPEYIQLLMVQIGITTFAISWVHTIYIYPSKIPYEQKKLNNQNKKKKKNKKKTQTYINARVDF